MTLTNKIASLLKMAEKLEDEGSLEEAASLFQTAEKLVIAAEKEKKDEKASRQMSGKAKAKFRAVRKACESLVAADLDYRGPNKSACRKTEMLCEEILEALDACDLD